MFDKMKIMIILFITLLLASCSLAIVPNEYEDKEVYEKPTAPTGLSAVVDYSDKTIDLVWDSMSGVSSYTVYYQTSVDNKNGADSNKKYRPPITTNSYQFSFDSADADSLPKLEENQIYYFSVSSANSSGEESEESMLVAVSTLSDFTFGIVYSDPDKDSSSEDFYYGFTINTINNCDVDTNKKLVNPTFTVELFSDKDLTTNALDGNGREIGLLELSGKGSHYTGRTLLPNTTYYYRVVMYVDGVEVQTKSSSFITSESYIAPEVRDLTVEENQLDKITLNFIIPAINSGLENLVERRLSITRVDNAGSDEKVLFSEETQLVSSDVFTITEEGDTLVCTYIDKDGIESGVEYQYTIESHYYFFEEENTQSGKAVKSPFVHSISTPAIDDEASSLKVLDEEKLHYKVTLEVYLPFGFDSAGDFVVSYVDNANQDDPAKFIDVETISNGNYCTLTGNIVLTEQEAESTHYYVFTVEYKLNDIISNSDTSLPFATSPTKENAVIFFSDFAASENLGSSVTLSWTEAVPDGYAQEHIEYSLYKSDVSAVYDEANRVAAFTHSTAGSYIDEDVEPGKTYYYILRADYNDPDSTGSGVFTMAADSGNRLGTVTDLAATEGEYTDKIVLTWSGVPGADGYKIYIDNEAEPIADEIAPVGTNYQFEYTDPSDAGVIHEFSVAPYDTNKVETEKSAAVNGNMLGTKGLNLSASYNKYGDRIELTWNEVPGATQYRVYVYYGEPGSLTSLFNESMQAGETSFTLTCDDERLSSIEDYALSRSFFFTVAPERLALSAGESVSVEGTWVQPPKNISATKGQYRDMTVVSWDNVDGASSYRVYRRAAGESDWGRMIQTVTGSSTTASIPYSSDEEALTYEYTVETVMGSGTVGPKQDCFGTDSSTGYAANIGVPLYDPQNITIEQPDYSAGGYSMETDILEISFSANEYATGYIINAASYENAYEFIVNDDGSISGSSDQEGTAGYATLNNGVVTAYVPRPIISYEPYISVSVQSMNEHATSFGVGEQRIPNWIYPVEIINISNLAIRQILTEVNNAWSGDWWTGSSAVTYTNPYRYFSVVSCSGRWGSTPNNAVVTINEFTYNLLSLTGSFGVSLDYGAESLAGYWGTDPIQQLTTGPAGENLVTIVLPFGLGQAQVTYNSVDVIYDTGTYTIRIDRNSDGTYEETPDDISYGSVSVEPF